MLRNFFGLGKTKDRRQEDTGVENWSFLKTDIHSHILPGIDDGAQTLEESLELVTQFIDMGYRSLVATPHIKFDHYPNTRVSIEHALTELRAALTARDIQIPVKAAAEYYIDDHFLQLLNTRDLMPVTRNEVLVELSFISEPVRLFDTLFKIQTAGYKPILAHPERYMFFHDRPDVYKQLKQRGCLLQLNTLALTGYYGRSVKQIAQYLIKERLYDYCGSDMHHLKHAENLKKMSSDSIIQELAKYPFKNSEVI